jgi:hypothetical protein
MSELQKTKKELIEILDQIPASGSFEGADLALKASALITRLNQLKAEQMQGHRAASVHTPEAMEKAAANS